VLYLYHKEAGARTLTLTGDEHRYLFKVRRHKAKDLLHLRNLEDGSLHTYEVLSIDKRSVLLSLVSSEQLEVKAARALHLGWCMIDPKSIEKVLPSLNEMGVEKITFIYCSRSQKSFKPDFKRWEKILLNSSQQSGRSVMMQLGLSPSLEAFLEEHPQSHMMNFSERSLKETDTDITTLVIGCEGGFTEEEVAHFAKERIVGFDTPLVLKSESAACAAAAKLLL
jgi:16S rRNA (uracil1498-N3)-methyltransferase